MDLSKRAKRNLKKNLSLSLSLCIGCTVFLLVCLSSMTWALFSNTYESIDNTISTAEVNLSLSLNKFDEVPLLLSTKNNVDDMKKEDEAVHLVQITENGDYEISIDVDATTSGYCTINITSNSETLLTRNIKVNLDDGSIKFNVHTNRNIDIEITNINWGNLESYDELDTDYYFGSYNVVYIADITSKLPDDYVELEYIESDGNQYTDIINVNDYEFSFIDSIDEESGVITYKAVRFEETVVKNENYEEIVYLVPCYEKSTNTEGIYDLLNNVFYKNKTDIAFIRGSERFNYCYDGLDFLSVDGKLPEKQIFEYGVINENKVSNCELLLSGFHFVGYKYNDEIIDLDDINNSSIDELFDVKELKDNEDIVLEAIFERDTYSLVFDDDTNKLVEVTYYDAVDNVEIPYKDGYQFLGYFDEAENKLFDEQGKFTSYKWTTLLENEQEIDLHSEWLLIEEEEGSIEDE